MQLDGYLNPIFSKVQFKRNSNAGKKDLFNPASTLASLRSKKEKLQEELHNIEKQVYELETSYLQESSHFGNAFKGFDGALSGSRNATNTKRTRKLQPEDRIFSLSSITSPLGEEQFVADGRTELGQVQPKGGGVFTNGQGRQKKVKMGQREGKKMKQSNDANDNDDQLKIEISSL